MAIFWKKSENGQSVIYQSKIKRTRVIWVIIILLILPVFAALTSNRLVGGLVGTVILLVLIFCVIVYFDNFPIARDQSRALKAGKKVSFSRKDGLDEITIEK